MEVMLSALLVALIVIAMFNGFDVGSRATASERSRSQADTLAQQAEDALRGLPIATLKGLEAKPRVEEVTQNGTKYTITSTVETVEDATATASCSSSGASASYLRTTSTVTWHALGVRKPVVETGLISPPPGSALIAEVTDASSAGVAGATVTATGPSPSASEHTLSTATNGCAVLALLPGEYSINVSKPGYVDQNWYTESKSDPGSIHSAYLVAETAVKEPYRFDLAGTLEVKFKTGAEASEGDSFVAFNSLMSSPAFKVIGKVEEYKTLLKAASTVFPVTTGYTVYAGTCEQNNPKTVNAANSEPTPVIVPAGGKVETEVIEPPVKIRVMSGTGPGKATEGVKVENATGFLEEPKEPEGCGAIRKFKSTPGGALPHPGMPFAEYKLCVTGGGVAPAAKRKYTTTFENDTPTGPSQLSKMTNGGVVEGVAVIYMGAGAPESPGKLEVGEKCP